MDIQIIPKAKSLVPEILNVAAYARVSSGKDAMLHSLSAQTSYYSELIQTTPNWNYVGVYADEAKSGTKDTRPEFQRMADDCRAGKIDMIITKSVSRFARNTVTLLSLCREFKAMGIDVYFEKENIHTKSEQGELMLTLLASFAQAEAEATSENVKWRIKERFKEGKPTGFTIYGYEVRKGKFTIVEEEAAVVREIFKMYLDGMGSYLIADKLNKRRVKSPYGGVWHDGTILKMLRNKKYAGDLELQKTFVNNPLIKKQILNKGQKEKYYVDNNHTPIIDRETFDKVQKLIGEKEKKYAYSKPYDYRFKGMVFCGCCGGKYYRNGVEVIFEKENIRTFDSTGELMLTIMSSLAQEESHSISKNVQWGWGQRIAAGKVSMAYGQFLGYEKGEDGKPKIVESEARIVRKIYRMFLEGKTASYIANYLTEQGVPTPGHNKKWSYSSVLSILKNEKYCGNAHLQKTITVDYLSHKRKRNEGEKESFFVTESHPAIVSQEVWGLVQFEFERRSKDGNYKSTKKCLSGKLFCADCGGMYGSKVWHSNDKYRRVIWRCNRKYDNAEKCTTAIVTEEVVKNAFVEVFNGLIENRDSLMGFVQSTIDKLLDTEAVDDKIAVAQRRADKRLEELGDYVKLNMRKAIPQSEYKAKYAELSEAREKAEAILKEREQEKIELINRRKRSEAFMRTLADNETLLPEFDEGLFGVTVERVTVGQDKLVFEFKDGYTTEYKL